MWGDANLLEPPADDFPDPGGGGFGGTGGSVENTASNTYNIQGVVFFLKERYKPRTILGRGAFGVVW